VAFAEEGAEYETIRGVAMHIAAMSPVAIDEASVPQKIKDNELSVAIEKTKTELVAKEVEVALKKAGINPAHVDSDDPILNRIWQKAGLLLKMQQKHAKLKQL
jgi:elongation factor Ts